MAFRNKKAKIYLLYIAIIYAAIMLWLLFGRSKIDIGQGYWKQLRMNINLVPFNSIRQYLKILINGTNPHLFSYAFINLMGNIVVFVPLGFLLPCLWERVQSIGRLLLCTISLIIVIELVQLFTLRGCCDIDDLILNEIGVSMGYIAFRFLHEKLSSLSCQAGPDDRPDQGKGR